MDIPAAGLKRTIIAPLLLALFSASLFAEDQNDTVAHPNNNKSTKQDDAITVYDTITVYGQTYRNTATKTTLEPEETPQGLTVIDNEQLQQREVQSLNQALRYTPGVVTETRGAAVTMYDTYKVRGFDVNQSYYDGLVLPYLSGWNFQAQADPIAVQQIEVFKGPTSVLYGAMNPGGMVNMIAKSPQMEHSTTVDVGAGSRNLMKASIDTTGQIGDSNLSYHFIGLARKQDSQVDTATNERYIVAPSLNWQVSDKTLINFNLYYQNDPAMGINSALPVSGMFISNSNGSTSPSTFASDGNWDSFKRDFVMAGYKIDHQFNDQWSFLQNARYTNGSLHQKNTYSMSFTESGSNAGQLQRNIYSTDENLKAFTIDNQFSGKLKLNRWEHNLLFGLDYQTMNGSSNYKEYDTSSIANWNQFNIFSPNNNLIVNPSSLSVKSTTITDVDLYQTGFYLQDQIRHDKLVLLTGGRFDTYKLSTLTNGTIPSSTDQNDFTYRVGALYTFDNGIAPYASYATGFEPTTGTDSSGNAYKPETSEQVEVGMKYQAPDMSKSASISLFHILKNDTLVADPDNYTNPKLQVGQVRSQGVELQGKWFVTSNLDISPSYTYTDMQITKDASSNLKGTTPIYVPTHAASIWANYYFYDGALAGTRVSGGTRYVGTMQMDSTNTEGKVPAYTITDLSLGYDLSELSRGLSGVTANFLVNNVFNTANYTCFNSTNCWYGEERSVELHVKYEM
ncbi:ligand-gated channel protein [Photobacterium kishitanii]|uniref:TonB-dependent siderophore receptor n=1 Tax=Photobacterium kishitanii TaxID=318456 RepID=A0AAX0YW85_9GAMM|nr:TonB-dependent siderophore receptor [Photobacterium kishitanii]KJG55399.1 ligand-gated channel protein [Photobacterium kishitanii]KJG57005.1 ligand-gated channel protein [Photobacterium kishitanii]KJG63461.1 ligand-gated channel protein [Photobacterium kishitanii]KJG66554.1 ligand-gated channel protein [Photobacterium kishitanii]PSX18241.1 TonB-dependent siderophore receptor [Photobacterium kishitanii]